MAAKWHSRSKDRWPDKDEAFVDLLKKSGYEAGDAIETHDTNAHWQWLMDDGEA